MARYNAPEPGTETWNSGAPESWPDTRMPEPIDFDKLPTMLRSQIKSLELRHRLEHARRNRLRISYPSVPTVDCAGCHDPLTAAANSMLKSERYGFEQHRL